jgi:hypothetical protein
MYRYGILQAHKSLSLKRKSLTSAWGRSLFSTRKPPGHLGSVDNNLPNEVAEVAEAAEAAPEVAELAELAEAAEAAAVAAAFRGELAASFARLEHFPIASIDAARHRVNIPGQSRGPYKQYFLYRCRREIILNGSVPRCNKWSGLGNDADPRHPLAGPPPMTHAGQSLRRL